MSPAHPKITTPHNKNDTFFPLTTLQLTVKPSVVLKCSDMDNLMFVS